MSLNSLSLGSWDFFGVGTRGDGRDVDREEESIGENLPMEGIYQQVFEEVHGRGHPAIHPWSHSMQDNHTDLNSTPNDYRPPLASYVSHTSYPNLWDTQDGPSYINQFPIDDVQFSVGSSQTSNPNSEILLRQLSPVLDGADIGNPREHPLYLRATTGPDGLYHCPWEADSSCNHKPEKLKCNYDKLVDYHLKSYRCKVNGCENTRFASTACLLRHEREAHAMHGHGEKPFLCTIQDCERSKPGNGFPRHWNLNDHMKRVHNISPSIHAARQTQPRPLRNKRHVHNTTPPDASSGDSRRVTPSEHRRQYSRHHSGPNEPLRRPGRPSYDVSEYDYDNARYRNPQGQEWREGLHNERLTGAESYTYKDTYAPPKKILSLAEKRFQDKGEELISMIKKVRHVEDKDALTSLRAAEDCLKVLTDEVMKTKTGPGWEVSRWDLERPD